MGQGYLIRAPKGDEHDITPIEAAALAYDALPDRPTTKFDPLTAVEFA